MLPIQSMYPITEEVSIDALNLAVERMILVVAVAKTFATCKTKSEEIDSSVILSNEDKIIEKKKLYGMIKCALNIQNDVDKMKEGKQVSDLSRRIIETEISDLTTRCGSLSEMHRFLNTSQDYYKQIIYS
jgi:hypothetical protein